MRFVIDLPKLIAATQEHYDLVVLVNPNSPTGRLMPGEAMREFLNWVPRNTRVWIDETDIDYAASHTRWNDSPPKAKT